MRSKFDDVLKNDIDEYNKIRDEKNKVATHLKDKLDTLPDQLYKLGKGVDEFAPKLRELENRLISYGYEIHNFNLLDEEGFEGYKEFLDDFSIEYKAIHRKLWIDGERVFSYGEEDAEKFFALCTAISLSTSLTTFVTPGNFYTPDSPEYILVDMVLLGFSSMIAGMSFLYNKISNFTKNPFSSDAEYLEDLLSFRRKVSNIAMDVKRYQR